jgi:hypothetical protein
MTVINQTIDDRVTKFDSVGNTYPYGFIRGRNTSGGDRTPADKAAGVWPDHAYSGTRFDRFYGEVKSHIINSSGNTIFPGYIRGIPGTGINVTQVKTWDANDEIKLIGKVAEKIRGSDWNAGIFTAELGKTVDMVAFRTRQLTSFMIALKKRDLNKAFKIIKVKQRKGETTVPSGRSSSNTDIQSLWLEARYGWRPLLKDIYDLSGAIQNLDVPRERSFKVSHFIGKSISSNSYPQYKVSGEGRYLKAIKATIKEKPFSLPEYLGLNDPEVIAWELVPFSFVADWFIPIGSWIETRAKLSGSDGNYVRTTYDWHRGRVDGVSGPIPIGGGNFEVVDEILGYDRSMNIQRTLTNSLDVPLPTWQDPNFDKKTRLADAIALLVSVFKGKG